MQKTIIHFIYNLTRGGAETMLVNILPHLPEYRNIVVTLSAENHFESELKCDELICLHQPSLLSIMPATIAFKKILKKYKPDLVHSHLPFPNFVARLAMPSSLPLITTIHNSIASSGDYKKWYLRAIDRFTFKLKRSTIIAVSKVVMNDYYGVLRLKNSNGLLLYNFVDVGLYHKKESLPVSDFFKVVCVGALSVQKNMQFLVKAFSKLKDKNIELHIYGSGQLQESIQEQIAVSGAKVVLKGRVININEVLPMHDLYVMSSLFEGFSLSILEAMATGLPLLISDIPSFREQCSDAAWYFDLADEQDFINKLLLMESDRKTLADLAEKGYRLAVENFTLEQHVAGLKKIYKSNGI